MIKHFQAAKVVSSTPAGSIEKKRVFFDKKTGKEIRLANAA